MARLDRFLNLMLTRDATLVRLYPGDRPILELPGGHRVAVSGQELLGAVLDGLAKEILPPDHEMGYLRGDQVQFTYSMDDHNFQVAICRSPMGTHIVAARLTKAPVKEHVAEDKSAHTEAPPVAAGLATTAKAASLDKLVGKLVELGGSDLYLCADEQPLVRRYGKVEILDGFPILSAREFQDTIKPCTPPHNWTSFEQGKTTEFAYDHPHHHCRLRMTLYHDVSGPASALRLIPSKVPDVKTLGLSEPIQRLANLNKGLVLVTGPRGSGRTTTVASLLDLANTARSDYIVTVEDSVEFVLPKGSCVVRQHEVGRDISHQKLAIRAALNQAPEILYLGELRDPEIIELAMDAAGSGSLVLATLPTATPLDTIDHLIGAFPSDRQERVRERLADSIKAIVCQTLLKAIGGGQAVAVESAFVNSTIAELIREGKTIQIPGAMKGARYGQVIHNDALVKLILNQRIDPMEAYLKCHDRESFIAACKKADIPFDPRSGGKVTAN